MPGNRRKILAVAQSLGGDALELLSGLPCRPVKGRWGVISALERKVLKVRSILGDVMKRIVPTPGKRRQGGRGVGEEEDQAFHEQQRTLRSNCVASTNNELFYTVVGVSSIAREPLTHFQEWMQKRTKQHNMDLAEARRTGAVPFWVLIGFLPKSCVGCTDSRPNRPILEHLPNSPSRHQSSRAPPRFTNSRNRRPVRRNLRYVMAMAIALSSA